MKTEGLHIQNESANQNATIHEKIYFRKYAQISTKRVKKFDLRKPFNKINNGTQFDLTLKQHGISVEQKL